MSEHHLLRLPPWLLLTGLLPACGAGATARPAQPTAERQAVPAEPDDPQSCIPTRSSLLPGAEQAVSLVDGGSGSGLSKTQLRTTVSENYPSFGECYEAALATNPDLAGQMRISFTVELDGSVGFAELSENTLASCEFTRCVLERFKAISFPKPDGRAVTAIYPLNFATE